MDGVGLAVQSRSGPSHGCKCKPSLGILANWKKRRSVFIMEQTRLAKKIVDCYRRQICEWMDGLSSPPEEKWRVGVLNAREFIEQIAAMRKKGIISPCSNTVLAKAINAGFITKYAIHTINNMLCEAVKDS
jgi:hypothetical protein